MATKFHGVINRQSRMATTL